MPTTTVSTPPSSQWLQDGTYAPTGGGTQTTYGSVSGSTVTLDLGSSTVPYHGIVAFNTTGLNMSSTQTYFVELVGCDTADFSTHTQSIASWNIRAIQQDVRPFDNMYDDVIYRYVRVRLTLTGTTPSITLLSFIKPLADLNISNMSDLIATQLMLCSTIKDAYTRFREWMTGVAWGGINNDGKYPLADGVGNLVYTKCPAQIEAESDIKTPLYYGALGDGNSHKASLFYSTLSDLQVKYPFALSLDQEMDYLGWQLAINSGNQVISDRRTYVIWNKLGDPQIPLKIISDGFSWIEGHGSVLDFSDMVPDLTDVWYNDNHGFDPVTGWTNATIYDEDQITNAMFTTGQATYTDPATWQGAQGNFCQFGTLMTLNPGTYEVILEGEATRGASYAAGNFNPPYAGATFFSDSPGEGSNLSGASGGGNVGVIDADTPIPFSFSYVFSLSSTQTGWLSFTGGGYANFRITNLGVKKHILNCAIWATRDGAADHYPLQMPFKGFRIEGPSRVSTGSIGIYIHSYEEIDGNCMNYEDVRVAGFESLVKFGNGAYLVEFTRVNLISGKYGYHFPSGLQNAGENFRLHGGGMSSCDILIYNPGGAEFSLFGSLLDYADTDTENNGQIIVGWGRIELHSVHCETRATTVVGKPLFDIYGTVTWFGGMILIAPNDAPDVNIPIQLNNSNSSMRFHDTDIYNLNSAAGLIQTGAGQLIGRFRNNGNPNMGMISDSPAMDVLGGAGQFPDYSGRIDLQGGVYQAYNTTQLIDQWNCADQTIVWSDDYITNGSNCIKVTKNFGIGTGGQIQILIPVQPLTNVFGRINFIFPQNVGTGTNTMYYRIFWVRQLGIDVLGRPITASNKEFKGEFDIAVPLAGSLTPIARGLTTTYSPSTDNPLDGDSSGAPLWATHLAVIIDTQSLPAMSFYITDMKANVL